MNPEKSNTLKSMGNTGMKKDEIGISAKKYDRLCQKSEAIRLPHYFSSSTGERRQLQNLEYYCGKRIYVTVHAKTNLFFSL